MTIQSEMQYWLPWRREQSADGESKEAVAQLHMQQIDQGFQHLIGFLVIQVLSMVLFAYLFQEDQRSVSHVIVILMTIALHVAGIGIYACCRRFGDGRCRHHLPSVFMGCVLVVEVALFAVVRADVQTATGFSFGLEVPCATDNIVCLTTASQTNLYTVTSWILYFVLLVLPFRAAVATTSSCILVYSMITLQAATGETNSRSVTVDLIMMGVTLLACLRVRKIMEAQGMKIAQSTLDQSEHIKRKVAEKVRQCEIEFTNEMLDQKLAQLTTLSQAQTESAPFVTKIDGEGCVFPSMVDLLQKADSPKVASANVMSSVYHASVASAPALLPSASYHALKPNESNCLPTSSRVWVESKGAFESVDKVHSGDRILCHDNLTGGVKYAAVSKAQTLETDEPVLWVTATLENGETLEVTADHPLMVWRGDAEAAQDIEGCYKQGHHIYAADLKVGQDTLMMLKTVRIPVKHVEHKMKQAHANGADSPKRGRSEHSDDSAGQRVALVVQQPDRHSILVSFDAHGSKQNFTAVGSAGICPELTDRMVVKNTFIGWDEDLESEHRRAHSEPPMLGETFPSSLTMSYADEQSARQRAQANSDEWGSARPRPSPSPEFNSETISITTSQLSSSPSVVSSNGGSTIIRICGQTPHLQTQKAQIADTGEYPVNSPDMPHRNMVSLSELQYLHASGLPSTGSSHANCPEGDCQPCAFHAKKQRRADAKDCRNGAFCDFCHVDEHVQARSAFRKLRGFGNMVTNFVAGRPPVGDAPAEGKQVVARKRNKGGINGNQSIESRSKPSNEIKTKPAASRVAPEFNVTGVPVYSA